MFSVCVPQCEHSSYCKILTGDNNFNEMKAQIDI